MILNTVLHGFTMSMSLIVAIGAQNAFVLKQGLKRQYVFAICLCCAISDALLICAGVMGFSKLILMHPDWLKIAQYAGASFISLYGIQHFKQAWRGDYQTALQDTSVQSFAQVMAMCLAFTWLNPHVYLDTVVLLGAISTQYAQPIYFALGAMSASFMFFFALGYASKCMQPLFQSVSAWQILDVLIGCVMLAIALSLIFKA